MFFTSWRKMDATTIVVVIVIRYITKRIFVEPSQMRQARACIWAYTVLPATRTLIPIGKDSSPIMSVVQVINPFLGQWGIETFLCSPIVNITNTTHADALNRNWKTDRKPPSIFCVGLLTGYLIEDLIENNKVSQLHLSDRTCLLPSLAF
jgi:hypothetical protein